MSNGSLQDCIYGAGEASKKKVLDCPTRISIALGLARGKFILPAHFCRAWSHS
ncbi:hypothetical protein Sjap_019906 [Stephania japonica]|uniref:Uncharacterized protein n=1 Tax=Stephania japonica TaxID=461633 RepID=A0AAP0F2H3_9MAGN